VAGALVVAALGTWSAASVEGDLTERAESALRAAGLGVDVRLDGRDVVVGPGGADDVERAAAVVAALPGVRTVRVDGAPAADPPAAAAAPTPSGNASGGDDAPDAADLVIRFPSNDAELGAPQRRTLDELADRLARETNLRVRVAGHADGSGREAANLVLSRDRAQAVAGHLVSRGVPAGRVTTEAYGDSRPVAGNESPDGRSRNRRVEIVLQEKS
jgi:outer membrane protein OmpA-like peptidoglycan-associated protein